MDNKVKNIIYRFAFQVNQLLGDSEMILYGSYARGDFDRNSDIDILILVNMTDEEISKIKYDVFDMAFDIFMETGLEISPVIENADRYSEWVEDLPYFLNIRNEGILING